MATIRRRKDKYQVQIRRKGLKSISRSFTRFKDAKEWARQSEVQADRLELAPDRSILKTIKLYDLVDRYLEEINPNKKSVEIDKITLSAFKRHSICQKTLANLTKSDFATYRDERLKTAR